MKTNEKKLAAGRIAEIANETDNDVTRHMLIAVAHELAGRSDEADKEMPSEAEMLENDFPLMEGDELDADIDGNNNPIAQQNAPNGAQPRKGRYIEVSSGKRVLNADDHPVA